MDDVTETIIPADEHSRGAKEAGVSEYIDLILADALEENKALWREGSRRVEETARTFSGGGFTDCDPAQQAEVLHKISGPDENDRFFVSLKQMTIDGYYTSWIGIHEELQYQENQVMAQFNCEKPGH